VRPAAAVALAVAACLAITGCLTAGTGSAIRGPVTVTFWHCQEGRAAELLEQMAVEFSAVEPDITVVPVYCGRPEAAEAGLLEALARGEAPVLAEVPESALPSLRAARAIASLEGYVANSDYGLEVGDIEDFWPYLVESNTTAGQVWGLPFSHKAYALVYNPELVPEPPATWGGLMETAVALTQRHSDPADSTFGLALTDDAALFCILLLQRGGALAAGDPPRWTFNDPAGVAALAYLYELASLRRCVLVTMGSPSGAVAGGRAAMAIDLVSLRPEHKDGGALAEARLEVAPLPVSGLPAVLAPGSSLVVTRGHSAAEREAAWRFMRWLTGPENALRWAVSTGDLPIRRSVVERRLWLEGPGTNPGWAAIAESVEWARALPDQLGWRQVEKGLSTAVSKCLFGQTTSLQMLLDAVVEDAPAPSAGN